MRVAAYVHSSLPWMRAGSEVMLHALLKALQTQGHEVRIAVTQERSAPATWEFDGIQGWGHFGRSTTNAATELARWNPDVVLTHHGESHRAADFAKRHGAKLVFLVHNDHPFTRSFIRGRKPDLTVFNTRWIHGKLKPALKEPGGDLPAVVVHPPVDFAAHRIAYGHMGHKVTLVNLHPKKGSRTFYALADKFPELQFLGVKGGYWTDQDVRVRSNVEIIENTTSMRDDVWAKTGVLLVPSVYESYGLVAVEAAASGIPVIASPTPGLRESMTASDGSDAAIFVRQNDVRGWHKALQSLTNAEEWKCWSAKTLARSQEIEDDDDMGRFLEAFEWAIVKGALRD